MSLIRKIKSPVYEYNVGNFVSKTKAPISWNQFRTKLKDMGFSIRQKSVLWKLFKAGDLSHKSLKSYDQLKLRVKRKRRRRYSIV